MPAHTIEIDPEVKSSEPAADHRPRRRRAPPAAGCAARHPRHREGGRRPRARPRVARSPGPGWPSSGSRRSACRRPRGASACGPTPPPRPPVELGAVAARQPLRRAWSPAPERSRPAPRRPGERARGRELRQPARRSSPGASSTGRGTAARVVDGAADADALLLVDPADGCDRPVRRPVDLVGRTTGRRFDVTRRCADVVPVDRSGPPPRRATDIARSLFGLLLAADALGGVQRMLDRTVAYAGQRQAFGKADRRVPGGAAPARRPHGPSAAAWPSSSPKPPGACGSDGAGRAPLRRHGGAERELARHPRPPRPAPADRRHRLHLGVRAPPLRAPRRTTTPAWPATRVAAVRTLAEIEGWDRCRVDVEGYRARGPRVHRRARRPHGRGGRARAPRRRRGARHPGLARLALRGGLPRAPVGPQEWGGDPDHLPIQDLVLMEELILGDAYRPLDQVMLAAHTLLAFGSPEPEARAPPEDPTGRAHLVPAVQRARCRQRPRLAAHPGRTRRRRLARDRAEDLEHRRPVGRHGHAARPHRPDRRPPRRHHRLRHPDGPARHRGPADPGDDRVRRVLRGVPRRGPGRPRARPRRRSTAAGR